MPQPNILFILDDQHRFDCLGCFGNTDVKSTHLDAIAAEGVTVLVVEQNTVLALSTAARGYVLENGRIALEGESQALLKDPKVREAYLGGAAA